MAIFANLRELRALLVPLSSSMRRGSCAKFLALLCCWCSLFSFLLMFIRCRAGVFMVHIVYFLLICTNLIFHSLHFLYFNKSQNVIPDTGVSVTWQQLWHIYKRAVRLAMLPTTTMRRGRKVSMKCFLCELALGRNTSLQEPQAGNRIKTKMKYRKFGSFLNRAGLPCYRLLS